jgi:hypothetical protein
MMVLEIIQHAERLSNHDSRFFTQLQALINVLRKQRVEILSEENDSFLAEAFAKLQLNGVVHYLEHHSQPKLLLEIVVSGKDAY